LAPEGILEKEAFCSSRLPSLWMLPPWTLSKAFDTLSDSILLEKPAAHGLDGRALRWVKNWLYGRAQRVVVNGVKSS